MENTTHFIALPIMNTKGLNNHIVDSSIFTITTYLSVKKETFIANFLIFFYY